MNHFEVGSRMFLETDIRKVDVLRYLISGDPADARLTCLSQQLPQIDYVAP